MKFRFTSSKSLIAHFSMAMFTASAPLYAEDYSFGSTTADFTLTATDQARVMGWSLDTFNSNSGDMGIYWRDTFSASDVTYLHFDVAALSGATINGNVNLNVAVNAQHGGSIANGQLSTANSAWSYPGAAPGFTAIVDSALLNGDFNTNDIASWSLSNATFQSMMNAPSSFHGLVLSGASGTTAHFSGSATLTGNANYTMIQVLGGSDWSAATWDGDSSTLAITGTSNVSGGNVGICSGATLSISDSATLGTGTFSGTIQNNGTLAIGSSSDQTLSGIITGIGSLSKSGTGTLTLSGTDNTFNGGITIDGGTLSATHKTLGTGAVTINNGGTLFTSNGWVFGGNSPYGTNGITVPSVTVNAGGLLHLNDGNGHLAGITNLYLNGGSITGGGGYFEGSFGALFMANGFEQITAGGDATSTISASSFGLTGNNNTITVEDGSTLNISSVLKNSTWYGGETGGFIKAGSGTLNLSGANTYTGITTVSAGILSLSTPFIGDSSAVVIASGAVLALNFSGSDTVGSLEIDGSGPLPPGTYNASHPTYAAYFSGTGSLIIPGTSSDYDTWGSSYGLSVGSEGGDPDNDGLTNHEEYAFGLIPNNGASANPITSQLNKTFGQFSYQRRDNALTSLTYTIWYSTDLVTWAEDTGASQPDGTPDGNGVETINVTLTSALLANPKLFVQVRAN